MMTRIGVVLRLEIETKKMLGKISCLFSTNAYIHLEDASNLRGEWGFTWSRL